MFKDAILNKIKTYVKSNYNCLSIWDFKLGEINYTFRCHLNAVQKVKERKAKSVVLVIAIDKTNGFMCVHFINKDDEGKYVDNTWGWLNAQHEYYYIRDVQESEYDTILQVLNNTKHMLVNLHSNWFQRLFVNAEKII